MSKVLWNNSFQPLQPKELCQEVPERTELPETTISSLFTANKERAIIMVIEYWQEFGVVETYYHPIYLGGLVPSKRRYTNICAR